MDLRKKIPVTNIGTVTLLMVFVILCMVTFANLALSDVAADRNFSRKMARQTTDYYTACSRADEAIAAIDGSISLTGDKNLSGKEYYENLCSTAEKALGSSEATYSMKSSEISFKIPVNRRLSLSVILQVQKPGASSGSNYEIVKYEEIPSKAWKGDNQVKLINP